MSDATIVILSAIFSIISIGLSIFSMLQARRFRQIIEEQQRAARARRAKETIE